VTTSLESSKVSLESDEAVANWKGAFIGPVLKLPGPGVWKDRAGILLSLVDGQYRINAGQLLGITPGSILEVRPPAGMGDKVIGHVKVTAPRPTDSDVVLGAHEKMEAPKELPTGARCKIVFVDFGEIQLRVSVATHYPSTDQKPTPVPPELRAELLTKLKKMSKPTSLFRAVDHEDEIEGWLRI